uniref:DNA-directed RNA polymerase I subunit D n=1 Tax=Romanomermis culicivorax TaxID=13658 RepID=A0A915KX98_ROMCU
MAKESTLSDKIKMIQQGNNADETCVSFLFKEEDHTLGNALKHIINKYPEVDFCGYNIPHPLDDTMLFHIQTRGRPAVDMLKKGLEDLEFVFDQIQQKFEAKLTVYADWDAEALHSERALPSAQALPSARTLP